MNTTCPKCGTESPNHFLFCPKCRHSFEDTRQSAQLNFRELAQTFASRSGNSGPGTWGVLLNYEPASLLALDAYLNSVWGTEGESPANESYRPSAERWDDIIELGSYVGEVLCRRFKGQWFTEENRSGEALWAQVRIHNSRGLYGSYPIARIFKRSKNGPIDNLWEFYQSAVAALEITERKAEARGFLRQAQAIEAGSMQQPDLAVQLYRLAKDFDPSLGREAEPRIAELTLRLQLAASQQLVQQNVKTIDGLRVTGESPAEEKQPGK